MGILRSLSHPTTYVPEEPSFVFHISGHAASVVDRHLFTHLFLVIPPRFPDRVH